MSRMRWAAGLIILLVAGCTGQPQVDDAPAPHAQLHEVWPGCAALGAFGYPLATPPEAGRGRVPDGFVPVTAMLCASGDTEATAGLGLERRTPSGADLAGLLSYLELPSQRVPFPDSQPCPAMAWYPPWLFLLDADGRWLQPEVPVDACGFARRMFEDGYSLPYLTLPYSDTRVCRWSPAGLCEPV